MSRRTYRWVLAVSTGVLWAVTIAVSTTDANIKIYLTIWLATLVSSLWALVAHVTRPDHVALALARTRIEQARANGALMEESNFYARRARKNAPMIHVV